MEGLPAAFDVEADGVHHAAGSLDGGGDGALVVRVGRHLRQPGAIGRLRMPRRHAHREARLQQPTDDAPAEKAAPAEDGDHRLHRQIGTASCRARGWQYVEISVAADSYKKK